MNQLNNIPWIIAIVTCLQVIGFVLARKHSVDTLGLLNYMVRYNVIAGAAAFYLIALIWIIFTITETQLATPVHYMIAASVALAGIVLPIKGYKRYKEKKKDETL